MRLPRYWPILLMQLPLAFLFCNQALGYGPWLSAFLTLLTLHPLTWTLPALLALHAMVNTGFENLVTIGLPLCALGVLAWLVRTPQASLASVEAGTPSSATT